MALSLHAYPGGKGKYYKSIMPLIEETLGDDYREPFFGGGSIGLKIATTKKTRCWFNDRDAAIHAVWTAVATDPEGVKQAVQRLEKPTVEDFRSIKLDFENWANGIRPLRPIAELAARKIALHRLSFSGAGLKASGPRGGWSQQNPTMLARWNADSICKKIDKLAPKLANIRISNLDFTQLIREPGRATIYLDPPYVKKGGECYRHAFTIADHLRLRESLRYCDHHWVLSYDECPMIRELYAFANVSELAVTYSMDKPRKTHELLITSPTRNRTFLSMAA